MTFQFFFSHQTINLRYIKFTDKVEGLNHCSGGETNLLAIGKHLCGGATDLSLRCLFNCKQNLR